MKESVYRLGQMLLSLTGQSDAVFFHPAVEGRLMKAEARGCLRDTARLLKGLHDQFRLRVVEHLPPRPGYPRGSRNCARDDVRQIHRSNTLILRGEGSFEQRMRSRSHVSRP